ncbi:putative UFSP, UFM1 processing protease [Monocercomonoides exilis]|uniref:putative UFSP, UFM1 processing protease n=1 Tax=Monocercomonoides exilis TaxID=2049356 RepID=UPI00355A120D|nr:putative UFSP, UFM1 processing protease [Monocercomonoides exilis]|eukprot:MONOS_3692.1-p1 / transcript=MONOS_3692.1 / gene=MONOS_3692 / organism=Monocercomonoides_exilis_PA203 / gene_product= UFSP, UFM1 processing protease / transcript_product= UFSP, UFM1 processing protease / location=Mono_scaffold00089:113770-115951(+) / protein_length=632 / sequence_SO=supercontig / SO=protein_coding / is_pseudo=false
MSKEPPNLVLSDLLLTYIRKNIQGTFIYLGFSENSPILPERSPAHAFYPLSVDPILKTINNDLQLIQNLIPKGMEIVGFHFNPSVLKDSALTQFTKTIGSLIGGEPIIGQTEIAQGKMNVSFKQNSAQFSVQQKPFDELMSSFGFFFVNIAPFTFSSSQQMALCFNGSFYAHSQPWSPESYSLSAAVPTLSNPAILAEGLCGSAVLSSPWTKTFPNVCGDYLSAGRFSIPELSVLSTAQFGGVTSDKSISNLHPNPIRFLCMFPVNDKSMPVSKLVRYVLSLIHNSISASTCASSSRTPSSSSPSSSLGFQIHWPSLLRFPLLLPISASSSASASASSSSSPSHSLSSSEDVLESIRQVIHRIFSLPQHPLFLPVNMLRSFNIGNCIGSAAEAKERGTKKEGKRSRDAEGTGSDLGHPFDQMLQNVHLSLPPTNHADYIVGLVSGSYTYYHYDQQGENDAGWGCAYRSLQTLCSWLQFQRYGDADPPRLDDIKETLVVIGDKQPEFLKQSNPWIGSIEISLLLDHFYNIESRIIHLSDGSKFDDHADELIDHFQTMGTPVMIGGGVLAYTLLGVRISKKEKKPEYLILDPHYPGKEKLSVICGRWVAWHPSSLFRNDVHYNLCLPQARPCI